MIDALSAKNLKPKFMQDSEGNLFIQIRVGNSSLTKPIPVMQTYREAEDYINKLVPEMAKELYKKRRRNKLKSERKS